MVQRGVRRAALILALALAAGAALAHQHQWVAGDALEVGERYTLERQWTRLYGIPRDMRTAALSLPWRRLIKVYERRMVGGELWYYVKAIRFETLNPNDHLWGWIAAADLRSLGVFAD